MEHDRRKHDRRKKHVTYMGPICASMPLPLVKPGTPMTMTILVPGMPPSVTHGIAYPHLVKRKKP